MKCTKKRKYRIKCPVGHLADYQWQSDSSSYIDSMCDENSVLAIYLWEI
jgi:hypothetical protein